MNDAPARERAAHAFDENVIVVAGAGTGKTSLLVERVICQMIARDLDVDAFTAITFTEKATAEMRTRLAAGLAELVRLARAHTPPADADLASAAGRAYVWLLEHVSIERIEALASLRLRDLERADISTIHSFCARLLRRFPIESGVDPRFSVENGLGFEELRRETWSAFLSGDDGPGGTRESVWSRVLALLDLAELEILGRACSSFEVPEPVIESGLLEASSILDVTARSALARIDALLSGTPADGPESWLAAARGALQVLLDDGLSACCAALDGARCTSGRGKDRSLLDTTPPTKSGYADAADLANDLYPTLVRLRKIDDELLSDALGLIAPYASAVKREARVQGILPYDALLALAHDLVLAHPKIRRELGARFETLFLDEFQDTDPLQYRIVFLIAEDPSSEPAQDAYDTKLAAGKLFIVGDPKQAIYRFRGADISAYKNATAHVVERNGGARLELVTNFRAVPEVLQPIDRLFEEVLSTSDPDPELAYSGYEGLSSGLPPNRDASVEVWTVGGTESKRDADEARHAEAEAIAAWVESEITSKRLEPKDVALLFRAMGDVHLYARALQNRRIPCLIGRSEKLESQPASKQLLALLRALANPADAPAVIGVLRSPLGAVPDAELAKWAGRFGGREREACWAYPDVEPPADELPQLSRGFGLLRELYALARSAAPERLLTALVEETPLLAIHAGARDGERRGADLGYLVEHLVEVAQARPGRDLAELVRELEAEERRTSPGDAEASPDRVRLFSIHGAKGLEFPVVILPDLSRGKGGGEKESVEVEWARVEAGHAVAISTRAGISSSWIEHERQETIHEVAEAGRVFYVACTRAERRLIFVHAPRKSKPPAEAFVHYLKPWGYPAEGLDSEEPLCEERDVIARSVPVPESVEASLPATAATPTSEAVARASRAVEIARNAARPPFRSPSGLREDAEARELASDLEPEAPLPPPPEPPSARRGRAIGTTLHDAFERWDFRDPRTLEGLVEFAARRVAADESLDADLLVRESRALAAEIAASELPGYLASINVLGRELPISFRDGDTAWNGTIDLLYRDTDGRLVVADYKSDRAPDDAARAHYREQLSTYARGVALAFPGEPEPALELIWLRSGNRERLG